MSDQQAFEQDAAYAVELGARAGDVARGLRVLAAQLDAGRAACRFIAAAGYAGRHTKCAACRVLVDCQTSGLWTPEEGTTT